MSTTILIDTDDDDRDWEGNSLHTAAMRCVVRDGWTLYYALSPAMMNTEESLFVWIDIWTRQKTFCWIIFGCTETTQNIYISSYACASMATEWDAQREEEVGQERGEGEIHDICEMENSSFCRRRGVCRLSVVGYWNVGQCECEFFFFCIFRFCVHCLVHLIMAIFLRHNRTHIFAIEISVFILFWFGERAAIPLSKPKRPLARPVHGTCGTACVDLTTYYGDRCAVKLSRIKWEIWIEIMTTMLITFKFAFINGFCLCCGVCMWDPIVCFRFRRTTIVSSLGQVKMVLDTLFFLLCGVFFFAFM